MFRYLISPISDDRDQKSIMIGFLVDEDTQSITGFMQPLQPQSLWSRLFESRRPISQEFLLSNCIGEYRSQESVSFAKPEDSNHVALHSYEFSEAETEIPHFHMKFKNHKQITVNMLNSFLRHLNTCKAAKDLAGGKQFITHQVRKEIIREYKAFYNQNIKGKFVKSNDRENPSLVASSLKSSRRLHDRYLRASNNLNYSVEKDTMPTIVEHSNCLMVPDSLGCVDRRLPELAGSQSGGFSGMMAAASTPVVAASIAIGGLLAYSVFRYFKQPTVDMSEKPKLNPQPGRR
jgi:hypothetical protein